MVHKIISAELPCHDHSFIACSRHTHIFLFFADIPFVVNHTINATPPERLQQGERSCPRIATAIHSMVEHPSFQLRGGHSITELSPPMRSPHQRWDRIWSAGVHSGRILRFSFVPGSGPGVKIWEKPDPDPESLFNFGSSRSLCGHMGKLRLDR